MLDRHHRMEVKKSDKKQKTMELEPKPRMESFPDGIRNTGNIVSSLKKKLLSIVDWGFEHC